MSKSGQASDDDDYFLREKSFSRSPISACGCSCFRVVFLSFSPSTLFYAVVHTDETSETPTIASARTHKKLAKIAEDFH